ncbi:hypothetical protein MLD38_027551 [Melastoma candidum]|uniref:Uncharacterized protein n=1 Tax=Melastoma candidum TaxID=119954 RepID=A0ACB9P360_9MYRT|nr:hypothetical protein MLD38_027551 [Melastoma candidum]
MIVGLSGDGQARHFFHCPLKAYSTGTRKRRKIQTNADGSETRWHKTGHSKPILVNGTVKGFKKILVLYTNFGKQRRPEKANWVMHQYHLGSTEEESDGELVASKVFYQTQPRQPVLSSILAHDDPGKGKTSFRDGSMIDDSCPTPGTTGREPLDGVGTTPVGIEESRKRKLARRESRKFD